MAGSTHEIFEKNVGLLALFMVIAVSIGGLTQIVPVLRVDGQWTANPLVVTDRMFDEFGRMVYGDFLGGDAAEGVEDGADHGDALHAAQAGATAPGAHRSTPHRTTCRMSRRSAG